MGCTVPKRYYSEGRTHKNFIRHHQGGQTHSQRVHVRKRSAFFQPQTSEQELTYAGRDVAARLLVALGAAVASGAGDAVLAGALAARLVAGLAARADGVAVAGCGQMRG